MWTADTANELVRLFAEVPHSVQQHGGDYTEVEQLLQYTTLVAQAQSLLA
jgi:hypothetical protein